MSAELPDRVRAALARLQPASSAGEWQTLDPRPATITREYVRAAVARQAPPVDGVRRPALLGAALGDDLIGAYLDSCRAGGLSPTTLHNRNIVLQQFDRDLPYGLCAAAAQELQVLFGRPMAASTRAMYYSTLRVFYEWCVAMELLDWSPMIRVRRPGTPGLLPKPCTDDQLRDVLDRAVQPWRLVAVLGAWAGLRACEIATLSWEHVTEDVIRVTGKGGKTAEVDTHPMVWAQLRLFPGAEPFIVQAGGRADPRWISRLAGTYFRSLGVDVTAHQFRHWYGTEILRRTGNLRRAQVALRHSSINSTVGYTQVRNDERRAAIHTLPTFGDDDWS